LVALLCTAACNLDYLIAPPQFAQLAAGPPPPVEESEDAPRQLKVPRTQASPALRLDTGSKSYIDVSASYSNLARRKTT